MICTAVLWALTITLPATLPSSWWTVARWVAESTPAAIRALSSHEFPLTCADRRWFTFEYNGREVFSIRAAAPLPAPYTPRCTTRQCETA